ncbi:hypothetical protein KAR91_11840 [Candidatus Pacearchaeota archaeon]|nr:hypothetical protein [Candidatus Pacearchaeota archaeon]
MDNATREAWREARDNQKETYCIEDHTCINCASARRKSDKGSSGGEFAGCYYNCGKTGRQVLGWDTCEDFDFNVYLLDTETTTG